MNFSIEKYVETRPLTKLSDHKDSSNLIKRISKTKFINTSNRKLVRFMDSKEGSIQAGDDT